MLIKKSDLNVALYFHLITFNSFTNKTNNDIKNINLNKNQNENINKKFRVKIVFR